MMLASVMQLCQLIILKQRAILFLWIMSTGHISIYAICRDTSFSSFFWMPSATTSFLLLLYHHMCFTRLVPLIQSAPEPHSSLGHRYH